MTLAALPGTVAATFSHDLDPASISGDSFSLIRSVCHHNGNSRENDSFSSVRSSRNLYFVALSCNVYGWSETNQSVADVARTSNRFHTIIELTKIEQKRTVNGILPLMTKSAKGPP